MAWLGEIIRIPSIQYLFVLFTVFVAWGMTSTKELVCGSKDKEEEEDERPEQAPSSENKSNIEEIATNAPVPNSMNTALALIVFVICYAAMVAVSVIFESIHIEMNLIVLMVICVALFTVLSLLVMIFQEQEQDRVTLGGPQLPQPNWIVTTATRSDSKEMGENSGL